MRTILVKRPSADLAAAIEVTVVIPCLDEADTLAACITKARQALTSHGIYGEIIVADNGSTDGSVEIAWKTGARVVQVEAKGYGNALKGGIAAANGKFIIMGDADNSYDFGDLPRFVDKLRQGYALVQGCRLPSGGGTIMPGAMPFLHRWWGNPMLSRLARLMFGVPVHDIYCGMRGFTRKLYEGLDLRCSGMEFATEMVIKSSRKGEPITEVPITLHPDGRINRGSHLRTFRDGWRTLRFFLLNSPGWLFLYPGILLVVLGLLGYAFAFPGISVGRATLGAHTLLVSSLALLLGYESILFDLLTRSFAVIEGLRRDSGRVTRLLEFATLEKGLLIGAVAFMGGICLLLTAVVKWCAVSFGPLDYASTMRWVIPGVTGCALGFQSVLTSFLSSIIGIGRR